MFGSNGQYDMKMQSQAVTALVMRSLVAGYIAYLGWKILSGVLSGDNSVPAPAAIAIAVVFFGGAIGFFAYAFKGYQKALKDAELEEPTEENNAVEELAADCRDSVSADSDEDLTEDFVNEPQADSPESPQE